eukprot:COSAG06_NODE_27778_length_586_cov_4.833676_2_plen_53_part_01
MHCPARSHRAWIWWRRDARREAREEQKLKESSHAILAKLERVDKRLEEVEQQK